MSASQDILLKSAGRKTSSSRCPKRPLGITDRSRQPAPLPPCLITGGHLEGRTISYSKAKFATRCHLSLSHPTKRHECRTKHAETRREPE